MWLSLGEYGRDSEDELMKLWSADIKLKLLPAACSLSLPLFVILLDTVQSVFYVYTRKIVRSLLEMVF